MFENNFILKICVKLSKMKILKGITKSKLNNLGKSQE